MQRYNYGPEKGALQKDFLLATSVPRASSKSNIATGAFFGGHVSNATTVITASRKQSGVHRGDITHHYECSLVPFSFGGMR